MKYDARACKFNMDTGCVELLLQDGRKISIDCTGVEDALDVTMAQRSELDYLIYNDPLGYADLILNGNPEEYLKNVTGSHGLDDSETRAEHLIQGALRFSASCAIVAGSCRTFAGTVRRSGCGW